MRKRQVLWLTIIKIIMLAGMAGAGVVSCSSAHEGTFWAGLAFDGKEDTRWASKPGEGEQWLKVDWGQEMTLAGKMTIFWEQAFAAEFAVQVSADDKSWTEVWKGAGMDGRQTIEGLSGSGRYLRILGTRAGQHGLYSIWEVAFENEALGQQLRKRLEEEWQAWEQALRERREQVINKHGVREVVFALRRIHTDPHWYANFAYYAATDQRKCYTEGGKLCKLDLVSGQVTDLVVDDKGSFRDPAVGYDGHTLVFAWRKGGTDHYHLYMMDLLGSGAPVQITDGGGDYDDIEPAWLPDGDIVFVSSRCKRWVNCWLTQVGIIYRCRPDGTQVRELSANNEQDNTPWVLPDGRILYMRWEYVDRSQVHYHHLWTMNPDGTNQTVFFGNSFAGDVYIDARPVPDSDQVVLVRSPGHGAVEHTGHIALVNPRNGPDDRSQITDLTPWGFRDPWALGGGAIIAANGRRMVMIMEGRIETLYELPGGQMEGLEIHEPRPVMVQERPRQIAARTVWSKSSGTLMLSNIYTGRNMAGVRPGEIKKLLILESLPKPINYTGGMEPLTYGGSFTLERIVGTVPVEEDGSAYFELPAMRSFFFVALDEQEHSVKRMQSFTSVMPGEVAGCVGCHESRMQTPRNGYAQGRAVAMNRAPSVIEPVRDMPGVIDFTRHIQPILDEHCVKCHNPQDYAGRVEMTGDQGPLYSVAFYNLSSRGLIADGRNKPESNYAPRAIGDVASRLMQKIGGEHKGVKVTDQQRRIIQYWLNSGATWPGTYAALGCGMVGSYSENSIDRQDMQWPEIQAAVKTMENRCLGCHKDNLRIPISPSDDATPPWAINYEDLPIRLNRHRLYNLSRPELSPLLLAPLAKAAGGRGMPRRDGEGKLTGETIEIFKDTADGDYQTLLAAVRRTKQHLDEMTRFNRPDFKPREAYLREMRRYGVLAADAGPKVDVYELDEKYWQSLWYRPEE